MNNWLNRLECKYGRFGIPNLTNILVAGQVLVFAVELFVNSAITLWLGLSRFLLLQGQVWRVLTFVFIPFSGGSILSVVLGIYFTWFIGTALEREWGDFRYTVYFLLGMAGTVLACLLTGVTASTYCLSLSLLLAFAMLYPEVQILLFFVIPIRVKYFGLLAAAMWVLSFATASLPGKLSLLLSMLNVWVFFAPMGYRSIRAWIRREQWKRKNRR
ncbi:MAG: rhomboid family intramembrane serine protease [Faecalibacterium prausnitzii]|nr:rhomboid family intramembrane serine protease [Faecalibacterium prausnitzii]MDD7151973.1 rhomboid family intramembrane serine protease [Faecalibacterium prausnitzii]MDY2682828.1 rhomboid family intramembrane serine protease [Faecalibacterium prausnitzii]